MGWSELSKIDLKSPENVLLYWRRWHPTVYLLGAMALIAVAIWGGLALVYADPRSVHSGRGEWLIALFLLLPFAVRMILVGLLVGFLAEGIFRYAFLSFGSLPAFVIGPDGIAALNPWRPRALTWQEIHKCTRVSSLDVWLMKRTMVLTFAGEKHNISIHPFAVGMTEDELIKIVERFAGRIVFDDVTYS